MNLIAYHASEVVHNPDNFKVIPQKWYLIKSFLQITVHQDHEWGSLVKREVWTSLWKPRIKIDPTFNTSLGWEPWERMWKHGLWGLSVTTGLMKHFLYWLRRMLFCISPMIVVVIRMLLFLFSKNSEYCMVQIAKQLQALISEYCMNCGMNWKLPPLPG